MDALNGLVIRSHSRCANVRCRPEADMRLENVRLAVAAGKTRASW